MERYYCAHILNMAEQVLEGRLRRRIYVQNWEIGLASYHFGLLNEVDEQPFICYSAAPDDWVLRDGSKVPPKKYFTNWSYDDLTRCFSGSIVWGDNLFDGCFRWEYRLFFTEDFSRIESGSVQSFDSNGMLVSENTLFGRGGGELFYVFHQFEPEYPPDPPQLLDVSNSIVSRVFVQGGQLGLASYHFGSLTEDKEHPYISYASAPADWRLSDGTRPPTKKYFENWSYDAQIRRFRGHIVWGSNTFSGASKWEYEIQFSVDFLRIDGGCINWIDANGLFSQRSIFGLQLVYECMFLLAAESA
jgi:hypothetical protein